MWHTVEFARSPQAKGRVERNRSRTGLTELRLVGATTNANVVLNEFLQRFNSRFKVPARELEVAYRAVDGGMCLERILCFKYRRRVANNTVRYRYPTTAARYGRVTSTWMLLKDGWLSGEGRVIPSQEAPPRPSVLRGFAGRTVHTPVPHLPTKGLGRMDGQTGDAGAIRDAEKPPGTSDRMALKEFAKLRLRDAGSDGQMESGAEGEAQGTVHSWNSSGAGYTRHREEVYECESLPRAL